MPRRVLILVLFALPAFAGDLTVGWISRFPEVEYVWNSANPRVEGWPAAGSTVTWRANVRSWFDAPKNVTYVWKLDGREIARGTTTLAPNSYTTIDLERPWTFTRERLSIAIDTEGAVAEESETNNALEIVTDAISAGFWVEQSFYDYFREHQPELGIGSTSFENWAQRMIGHYNEMAAMAVYPETPQGVHDRWRLQQIVVVPDGALPLVPPAKERRGNEPPTGATQPSSTDRTVDLQWGFRASAATTYRGRAAGIDNPFYIDLPTIHELGHARYLTDVYAFDVRHQPPSFSVGIGDLAVTGTIHSTPEQGLMNRMHTFIDRYSAAALNLIAGHRATRGNYNDPENVGAFLNDLPAQNRLTIRDAEGNLMANADVEIFMSKPTFLLDAWYATDYDDVPDMVLRTDSNGQVLAGRNPFSDDRIVNDWRGSNVVAIVKAGDKYGFLESRLFNLAYWRGETFFADHELIVGRTTRCAARGPGLLAPEWGSTSSTPALKWSKLDGAVSYHVWAASPTSPSPRLLGTTTSTELTATFSGRTYWWVEATFEGSCPPVRSDASRVEAPVRMKRRAVR